MFDYVSSNVTLKATMVQTSSSIVVTLGTPKTPAAVTTALLPGAMTLTPGVRRHRRSRQLLLDDRGDRDDHGGQEFWSAGAVQRADDKVQAGHHLFGFGPRVGKHGNAEVPRPIPDREGRPPQPHAR